MFLKSLELEGFKSFVDGTSIKFPPGFTAIVGPNGCGKSNVSDAIRWVIGEQSSKSLRGTRITDLIFNGSADRKPVNRASISLTLSNVPAGMRIANVPNVAEDVKVTRSYHRSGESEFYINDVPCRLKDITDFLLDVGISPKVLTVIEQGHIQDVITSKPENRRILIEEAAGILKFKHRRNEALRKLEASRQNLERITDIVQELGRRVESLKRQATKADRYKRYQGEIKDLSLKLFAKKHTRLGHELTAIEESLHQQIEQKNDWATRSTTLDNDIERIEMELEEAYKSLNGKKEAAQELTSRIAKDEHSIELKQGESTRAEADIRAAVGEISRMKGEIDTLTKEMEENRSRFEQVIAEIGAQEDGLRQATEFLDKDKETLRELEGKVRSGDQRILELYHRISRTRNKLTAIETRKQALETQHSKLISEQTSHLGAIETNRQTLQTTEQEHIEKQNRLVALTEQKDALTQEISSEKASLASLNRELSEVKEAYLSQTSLLSSLKEIRHKFEGFQEGVKSLMVDTASGERLQGLREVVADVLKTPAEYEYAIETVLGEKLQSIIVNSYTDTVGAIDFLKNNQSGRGTFLPMNPKSMGLAPVYLNGNVGVLGKACDVIECKEEYRPIINHLLSNVVLVQDLETAFHLQANPDFQGTVVTLNGEMIDFQGMVSGGGAKDSESGLLAQNREIEELTEKARLLREKLDSATAQVEQKNSALNELENRLREVQQNRNAAEIAKGSSQKDLEQLKKELERLEQKRKTLEHELTSGGQELQEILSTGEALNIEIAADEENKLREEEALAGTRDALAQMRVELEKKSADISQIRVLTASLKGRRETILGELKRVELHQENLRHRIQRREKETAENSQKIAATQQEIQTLESEILNKVKQKDLLREEIVTEEDDLRQNEEQLKDMEQETRELSKQVQEITETISKIEIRKSETKIQMAHLEEKAYEDCNATLQEMLARYEEDVNEQEIDERVRDLKEKIGNMGEVNLAALSEFEQTNERYVFLKNQQDDLAESIALLHTTIEKINRNTRNRFLETFHLVNDNFKQIFARLFRGGQAELKLTDDANVLEAGIEISVNPMGKRMQNLSLLSGGEKSMTAIALMFAVFKVRPSPFCLLDEVDAPLDEANVVRFQEMLKEMATDTQFIIITHNQRTMSFADALYGITMEEQGVSKAVSVHLN